MSDTLLQLLALAQAHFTALTENAQMTTVGEPYLTDYERYITEFEQEFGVNLQRFRIPESAIETRRSGGVQQFDPYTHELISDTTRPDRFCAKSYFLGQLNAFLGYMQSQSNRPPDRPPEPPETWPSDIID